MNLSGAQQILSRISCGISSAAWDQTLTTSVQTLLAVLCLLSPYDDVDGQAGRRTLGAWKLFKITKGLANPDALEPTSAAVLIQASSNREVEIGRPKVGLQPDFPFRRGATSQNANQQNSSEAIIAEAKTRSMTKPQIAYILATAQHESDVFETLEEYADGSTYEGRGDLGNTETGDGPLYKGRGYVQLTGRRNYTLYRDKTGVELVKYPLILMNWPALSVFVIVDGMKNGIYSGRRLDEFVNDQKQDFFNARQVVNGHDCAEKIEALANAWLARIA